MKNGLYDLGQMVMDPGYSLRGLEMQPETRSKMLSNIFFIMGFYCQEVGPVEQTGTGDYYILYDPSGNLIQEGWGNRETITDDDMLLYIHRFMLEHKDHFTYPF